ncbi:type 2 lantipeptide synthetase LanM family protein [Nostocales cyanobacterium LEGE 12452]|nr:type 2 lantipeptide synthetase LanM family protein [Nostocales cyanobacterium LEGE 12452]
MTITGSDLSQIANNATFISERINNPCFSNISDDKLDQNIINKRIKTWCEAVGGEEKLKQRLHWYGLDLNTSYILLGATDIKETHTPSPWLETLKELIQSSKASLLHLEDLESSPIDPKNSLAFEDFYLPYILVGRRKLYTRLSANISLELLSKEAYKVLEHRLLQQLVNLGTETLLFEFNKFCENHTVENQTTALNSKSKVKYYTFIENLLQDGGLELFQHYPVLARLIATTIDFWVEFTIEFIQRLRADVSAIESTFSDNISLGIVKDIDTSLSDLHNGGRCVLALTFSSDVKLVYKPKNLDIDIAFNHLLDWCNQQEISLNFKLTRILNRQGYGWVEFIVHQPCENQAAVKRFYQRAGLLLCLLFVLGARNCHAKNVIANGEYPTLIDADTLMHPQITSLDESENWFKDSVVSTGLLPSWEGNIYSDKAQDSSVVGHIFPQEVNFFREWKFINTDEMHLATKTLIIPSGGNVVILEGKTVSPNDYIEDIITGFKETYSILIKHRETLLSKESPLSAFKFLKSRLILRPAIIYSIALKESLSPQYLRNGVDYSILIDTLSSSYLTSEENPDLWSTLQAEIKYLQQQDIPCFSVFCHKNNLESEIDNPINCFFKASSYQRLIAKLQSLDERNLALQIKLIRGSFYAKVAHLIKKSTALQGDFAQFASLTPEELLQEALKIGNSLVANAIQNAYGCNWFSLEYMFKANRYQLQPLDDSLYTGRAGVSLFLAALAKITGKREFQEVALAALLPLRQSLKKTEASKRLFQPGLGLLGLGGIIYSLVKISQFLQEPTLLEDAQRAAKLVTPEVIATDQNLDMMWGVAGTILGLLPVYQETGEQAVLEIAIACGNHLLSQRSHTIPKAWNTLKQESKKPLTGFSHGASGISFSLLRLYTLTGDTAYLTAAKEGIEYEQSVFNQSAQNWPDFRLSEQMNRINFLSAWCHGSVGIGLARLGSLPIIYTEKTYSDINIALETTQKYGMPSTDVDHLCCGSLGRTELFVVASQKLDNQEWLETARKQAAWVLARAKENGRYAFLPHLPYSILSPSFYRGSAGVGYQLLRLFSPESLPSVLIWE